MSSLAAWTNVGVGIDYQQFTITMNDAKPNRLFVARMESGNTNCIVGSMIASNRVAGATERTSAQASRYEDALNFWGESWGQRNDVVVAINGSFFDDGVITGGHIYDGWYSKRFGVFGGQMGFVWKLDRSHHIGVCVNYRANDQTVSMGGATRNFNGINIPRTNDQLILYTPQYNNNTLTTSSGVEVLVELTTPLLILNPPGVVTGTIREVRIGQGSTRIPFDHLVLSGVGSAATYLQTYAQVGQTVTISQQLLLYNGPPGGNLCSSVDPRTFHKAYALAQGNFHFLKQGVIVPTDNSGMIIRNPRTFVAYNSNYVYFAVCDGRTTASVGMTSDEMGAFCLTNLLAIEGVNMDGGGSSTMWLNGLVRNTPSDGSERRVANGLMLVNLRPKTNSTVFAPGQTVRTSGTASFRLGPGTDYFSFMNLASGAQGTIVNHSVRGIRARSNFWWKCDFGGTNGWIAETSLVAPTNPPHITLQPSNQIVATGGNASFAIVATGSNPLRFQWQKNLVNLTNGGHYAGCTNPVLTITSADANAAASYRCVVTNNYGSSNSMVVTLTLFDPPPAPSALPATAITSNSFTANWSLVAEATGYRLDISATNNFSSYVNGYQNLNAGNATSCIVTGLSGATTYYYRVRAYNNDGTGADSGTVTVTTAVGPPAAPAAAPATHLTSISFVANWNPAAAASGYRLDVSPDDTFGTFVNGYDNADAGGALNLSVSGLNAGGTYYYRARAYNVSGVSANSGTVAVTLPSVTPFGCVIVSNANFEGGFSLAGGGFIANGWTEWEALPGVTIGYDETALARSGAHAQRIRVWGVTNVTAGGVYQRVPAIGGLPYSISVWSYAGDPLSFCSLGVDPAGGTSPTNGVTWSPPHNTAAWVKQTWTGLAAGDYLTVFLRVTSQDSDKRNGYFDDLTTTEQKPQLQSEWTGNQLILTWPDCPQARLKRADSLTPPASWITVTNEINNVGGLNTVTLSPEAAAAFFRLILE